MKKNLIMAVAATLAVGQLSAVAHAAGPGRSSRPEAVRGRETETARRGAETAARTGADSAGSTTIAEVARLNLTRTLDVNQLTALRRKSNDPAVDEALKNILSNSSKAELEALSLARMTAIANLPPGYKVDAQQEAVARLSPDAQNELAYAKFALRTYTKDFSQKNRDNLTFLFEKTNEIYLASGGRKTIGESFKEANDMMAKSEAQGGRSTRLELAEANKYCK
ncbi:MAG: hypothetical protein J0L82_09365 [Deltaproteobacteria bacterium]|jgi:hypothetical protein|nr:hypothetical protein [Deltaproteobacteria bacterium]